ncbi:MAG TPA: chloride channel protein [Steroidobacteraceae bacterium]|jgi:H+/Cl- antiporter ClcA|nr:chloride channel protein [Steroidobacteraceae bacterium]
MSATIAQRRVATAMGAILLSLAALAFARFADVAQLMFRRIFAQYPHLPLLLTPAIFAAVAFATRRWANEARGSGIPQIIAAAESPATAGAIRLANLKIAISKLFLTLLMLLGGASVGREGPTVQVSAAVMVWVHRLLRVPITAGVLIAGGAAGVAAAFNTPLAGVAFAIEELAAAYEQRVALLVMAAVMISGLTMIGIAGDYVYFGVLRSSIGLRQTLVLAPVVGIVGGISGGVFSRVVLHFSNAKSGWAWGLKRRPVLFAAGCGLIVAVAGIVSGGATWGTGYVPARALIEGGQLSIWFGPAKFVASIFTTLSGTPGGIFSPSLAVGAGVGNALAGLFPRSPTSAIALLGMAAYFVGVVRAPLTAVIILMETTASRSMILPLFATALIADATSALICPERIYHGLSRAFVSEEPSNGLPPGPSS